MRLQLAALLALCALLWASHARAQLAKVDSRSSVYQDTDRTTIVTSNVAARATPTPKTGIDARYLVDVISSASVDVISAATTRFRDTRHELEGGARWADDTRKLGASYIYSTENDWRSHTGGGSFSHDLASHQLTLKLGGSLVTNDVLRTGDPSFRERLVSGSGTAGLTIVAGRNDLVDVTYALAYLDGFQSSPYRFVYFRSGAGAPLPLGRRENVPDTRARHALAVRWNRHLFKDTALRSHARGYVDDWGIVSVTAGTEYAVGFGSTEGALFVRGYAQGAAAFYRSAYDRPMQFMTSDRELSPFVDAFGGARIAWRKDKRGAFEDLRLEAKVTGFVFRFFDFPRLPERSGVIGELALGVSF
jgi:hypothetical protein